MKQNPNFTYTQREINREELSDTPQLFVRGLPLKDLATGVGIHTNGVAYGVDGEPRAFAIPM